MVNTDNKNISKAGRSVSYKILCRPRQDVLYRKYVAEVHRVEFYGGTGATQCTVAHRTQEYLNQHHYSQMASNERYWSMKREMEQQIEFLGHQFQALKDAAEKMGIDQNKIFYLKERSRADSEAHRGIFANQD